MRWLMTLAVILVVGLGAALALRPQGIPVDVVAASRQAIREYVEEEAKTRLPDTYQITMPLQGRILPIELDEGDRVEAGQVVARMDVSDLDTDLLEQQNSVRQYERNLEQIELAIEQAEQTVKASQAKYDFAERVYSRTKSLLESNTASVLKMEQDELQMTESALDLRKEQLNRSIYVIMRGVIELMRDTEQAKQVKAERDRNRAVITSPVAGVVLAKERSNEQVLAAGELLLTIGDPQQLQVEAEVLTQDVVRVEVGDPVDIEGPAIGPEPVAGRVAKVYPRGFTKVSSLGVEQQRVLVVIDFDAEALRQLKAAGRELGVDYRVRIKIFTDIKESALVVPRAALFRGDSGAWQLFRVRDNLAELVTVEVGLRNDFFVEILSGLSEADWVIEAPESTLEPGTLLAPLPPPTPTMEIR